jgi:hypothetical protein
LALSTQVPSAQLRYFAHSLATTTFHAHPSCHFRVEYLVKLLAQSVFPAVKECAVGWFKTELMAGTLEHDEFPPKEVFARLAPLMFPPISEHTEKEHDSDEFVTEAGFRTASLNLLYLLLQRQDLRKKLGVDETIEERDISGEFIEPLKREAHIQAMQESHEEEDGPNLTAIVLHVIESVSPLMP